MNRLARIKRALRNSYYHKYKYINGTRGVISLFLAILMLPFVTIAGSLINAARVSSAVAIFDEALCNASNSTLGTYDSFLRKRFGLLAMSQNLSGTGKALNQYTVSDLISETFEKYMEENLKMLSNTYITSESKSEGIYSLSDPDVLLYQTLEYSKYSVPTKLVEDSLPFDDMLKALEAMIPGSSFFDLITAGAGAADSFVTLSEDLGLLKDVISEEQTAYSNYSTAYNKFSSDVTNYLSKKQEMETALQQLQATVDEERAKISDLADQIEGLEGQIQSLQEDQKKTGANHSEQISQLQEELNQVREDNADDIEAWETARNNYNTSKSSYETQLANLEKAVKESKTSYSSSISGLSSKLKDVQTKLTTVQGDFVSMETAVENTVVSAGTTALNSMKSDNSDRIKKLEEQIKESDDEDAKKELTELKDSNVDIDNTKTVLDAYKSGYTNGLSSVKEDVAQFNVEIYSQAVESLTSLKTKVDKYGTVDGSDDFIITSVSRSEYFREFSGLLTKEAVEKAESECVEQMVSASIWGVIKAIVSFFEALLSVTLAYDQKLGAVIDSNYYNSTYNGLPSEKDRTKFPLYEGSDVAGDKAAAQKNKELFGDYSATDRDLFVDFDLFEALQNIFTAFSTITGDIAELVSGIGLLFLAQLLKEMYDAVCTIVNNITGMVTFLGNVLKNPGEYIGKKLLLTGYVHYMTSDRVTYKTGKALTGTAFNERGQETTSPLPSNKVTDMLALVRTIYSAINGGTEKCFVGAEKEYIMFGSPSELVNQCAVFGGVYLVRLVANLFLILTNPEVESIAASATIAYPIVMLVYILVEPLIDTILLVNGGEVRLVKTKVYLTPSGIFDLITSFSKLKLNTAQAEQLKKDLGVTDTKSSSGGTDVGKYFTVDYSKTLFIIMLLFTPRKKMLSRLSNIIEMEAVEYMNNNKVVASNGLFDLDYSYTYIRTEATFTMNEFIPVSGEAIGFNKKRVVYKGY